MYWVPPIWGSKSEKEGRIPHLNVNPNWKKNSLFLHSVSLSDRLFLFYTLSVALEGGDLTHTFEVSAYCLAWCCCNIKCKAAVYTAYVNAAAHDPSPACRSSCLFGEVWSSGEGLWSKHGTRSQEDAYTQINLDLFGNFSPLSFSCADIHLGSSTGPGA